MKNKAPIYALTTLVLTALAVFFWNNFQIQIQERPNKPIKLPPQFSGQCGMENCHGLDITCGPNIPEACTAIYMAGDNCRQFTGCQIIEGQCRLISSPKFDSCKACVKKCEQDFQNDHIKFFECESKCAN